MRMLKFMVAMPPRQKTFLDHESDRLGISVGELLRRIVDQYGGQPASPPLYRIKMPESVDKHA